MGELLWFTNNQRFQEFPLLIQLLGSALSTWRGDSRRLRRRELSQVLFQSSLNPWLGNLLEVVTGRDWFNISAFRLAIFVAVIDLLDWRSLDIHWLDQLGYHVLNYWHELFTLALNSIEMVPEGTCSLWFYYNPWFFHSYIFTWFETWWRIINHGVTLRSKSLRRHRQIIPICFSNSDLSRWVQFFFELFTPIIPLTRNLERFISKIFVRRTCILSKLSTKHTRWKQIIITITRHEASNVTSTSLLNDEASSREYITRNLLILLSVVELWILRHEKFKFILGSTLHWLRCHKIKVKLLFLLLLLLSPCWDQLTDSVLILHGPLFFFHDRW